MHEHVGVRPTLFLTKGIVLERAGRSGDHENDETTGQRINLFRRLGTMREGSGEVSRAITERSEGGIYDCVAIRCRDEREERKRDRLEK